MADTCSQVCAFALLSPKILSGPSCPVLFVADLFHPVDGLAVELLLDGDMSHCRRGRCSMPVLLTGRKPDDIARPDFLDGPTPMLRPAAAGRHNQCLTEWMSVPCGPCARFERDAGASAACGFGYLEQGVNADAAGEIFRRTFSGGPRAASFDFHCCFPCVCWNNRRRYDQDFWSLICAGNS